MNQSKDEFIEQLHTQAKAHKVLIEKLVEALEGARSIMDFDLAHCLPTSASADAETERQTYRNAITAADVALAAARVQP